MRPAFYHCVPQIAISSWCIFSVLVFWSSVALGVLENGGEGFYASILIIGESAFSVIGASETGFGSRKYSFGRTAQSSTVLEIGEVYNLVYSSDILNCKNRRY